MRPHLTPWDHNLNNFKFTLSENTFTQVIALMANFCLKIRFLKTSNKFSIILNYLPLKESIAIYLKKHFESPSPKDTSCQVWMKLVHWSWKRSPKRKTFKDRQRDGRTTDNWWSEKLKWYLTNGILFYFSWKHLIIKLNKEMNKIICDNIIFSVTFRINQYKCLCRINK